MARMAEKRFSGKVVLVSGAGGGLGRLAAARFAAEGAHLVIGDLDAARLGETAKVMQDLGARVVAEPGDIGEEATSARLVAAALATFERLDVAINNAGVAHDFMKLPDTPADVMERMVRVNLMGVFFALKHQVPAMERQGGGVILNVASAAGIVGAPLLAAYAAAKHGVVGLTKSAAGEGARKNIRINAICPSFTATDMVAGFVEKMQGAPEQAVARITANVPMRRLARPDEIVQAMLWMCGPENSFMTGHAMLLDGGLTAV